MLLCDVELVAEEEATDDVREKADKARHLFRQLLRLNAELKKMPADDSLLVCSRAPASRKRVPSLVLVAHVCVTTETRHLDRVGQLGEFEQESNTG